MEYQNYDELCEKQKEINKKYLEIFERDLKKAGLKQKTIKRHLFNADLYINTYLLREGPLEMAEGCNFTINSFMGCFYIYKCIWSNPYNVKTTAASIKKFYKSMKEHGYVNSKDYKELCNTIKEEMEDWQEECGSLLN
ncbi:MAG: recombinase [Clostridia bacterium]